MTERKCLLLAAALVMLMVGCFPTQAEPVTLRFAHWLGGDAFQEEVKLFEQLHPDIRIELEPRSWNEHHEKLQIEVASGVGADVYLIDAYYFASLFSSGIFLPLETMVEESNVDLSGFVVDPFFEGGYDGHLYALALHHPDNHVLWANSMLLEQAGIPVPQAGEPGYGEMSWDDFRGQLMKLTETDGQGNTVQYGLGPMGTLVAPYIFFAWNNGGELFDAKDHMHPTKALIDEPAFVEGYEYLTGLVLHDRVSPLFGDAYGMFGSGTTAYQFDWSVLNVYKQMPVADDVVVLPLPLPENYRKVNKVGGNSVAIARTTKSAEAAFEFITWLTTSEEAIRLRVERSGEVPAYMPWRHLPDVSENRLQMSLWSAVMWQFEGAELRPWWFGQASFTVMSTLEEATIRILTGEAPAAIALKQAAQRINGFL